MDHPAGVRTDSTYSKLSELLTTTRFAQSTNPAATTNTYDSAGRLSLVDGPLANDEITYGYDALWRTNSVTYEGVTLPSSSTKASVSVVYDDAGEQLKVSQPLTTSTTMTRNWTYDQAGRQVTATDPAGTTTTTYNKAGWVTQVADPRPATVSFGYDNLGRRICRHTAACTASTSGAESWAYDAAGNMTQAKNGTVTFNMTYDNDGRLYQTKRGTTLETTYNYAPTTGLLTSVADAAGTTAYTYNPTGQVWTVDDPFAASSTELALDRARTRAYNGTTTTYTYSGISEQVAQTVAGSTTTTYAFTPGGHPMAQKVGSAQASYHLLDTHSDVVGLVSSAGANQGTTSYDAYGGVLATTGTQGIVGDQGDITDAVTRQVDMGTRWYAPGQGRFTSRDVLFGELSSPMTLNQFAYAGMNPITMWDPTGMQQAAGEGGGGGNGCDNACQKAQDSYCATRDCGHTDGAPIPRDPLHIRGLDR